MNAASKPFDGTHKYIRITDIDEITSEYKEDSIVSPAAEIDEHYRVKENDILFARTGASTGKTYLYNHNDGRLYYAGFLIRMNVSPQNDSRFIFYQTQTLCYKKWVQVMSMRSGQPGINSQELSSYRCFLPKLEEQQRIANLLALIDQRISIQNKVIERYQSLIRAITQTCFQGKYEYSQIPLSEIAPNIASGKSKPTAGKYPLYGSTGIIGTCSSGAYKGEMVLVARVGSIGQVQLINTSGCGITDNTLIIDSGELNRYVYFFLKTFDFHKITSGTTQPLITGGSLKRISVPILPATKRGLFISLLSAIEQRKKIEQELLQYYLQSKSYVLANMFI